MAPQIVSQPADLSVQEGQQALFTVSASGTAPLGYQWKVNGADIAGANASTYSIAAAQAGQSGANYSVTVSNAAGTATSRAALLTVSAVGIAPRILVEPSDIALLRSQPGTLAVTAAGTGISYQWQRSSDGIAFSNVGGATAATLSLPDPVLPDHGSSFRVIVSSGLGAVTSRSARLSVEAASLAPIFTAEPESTSAVVGQSAQFSIQATGLPTPTLQWQSSADGVNWVDLAGQTAATLTTPALAAGDDGKRFRAVATNAYGAVVGRSADLSVAGAASAPVIVTMPSGATVGELGTATFSAGVAGSPAPTCQWQVSVDGGTSYVNIVGATGLAFTAPPATLGDSGKLFRVQASNASGTTTHPPAMLTVVAGPHIVRGPASQAWRPGTSTPSFAVEAVGTGLTYQWQISSDAGLTFTDVPGATAAVYAHAGNASDATNRVRVRVGNGTAATTSATATLSRASRWTYVLPQPTGDSLYGVHWVDSTHAVATGDSGTLLRSADSGQSWAVAGEGDANATLLFGVAFGGPNVGVAVGASGWIRRSTDGGASWRTVRLSTSSTLARLNAVAFADESVATAVGDGGTILRSSDGGSSWSPAVNSGGSAALIHVQFGPDGTGIAVGANGALLRSINGGRHWSAVASGSAVTLRSVSFAGSGLIVVVGDLGTVLRSTDGGVSWQAAASGTTVGLNAVHFGSATVGAALTSQATILYTVNGGTTWAPAVAPARFFSAVRFGSGTTAVAVGGTGAIARSTDGGLSWTDVASQARASLFGIAFATTSSGVAVGEGGTILRTTDGGGAWSAVASNTTQQLQGVAFADTSVGVAVGYDGTVVRTVDGGASWVPVPSGSHQFLMAAAFPSATVGVVASSFGLLRSTDAGASWSPASGAQAPWNGVAFGNATVGVAVGPLGGIVRSADGGQTWSTVASGTTQNLLSVAFADANTVVATGEGGAFLRSADGGQTWSVQSIGPLAHHGMRFASPTFGVAVGTFCDVLPTADGGLGWGSDLSQKSATLFAVAFAGPNVAIAVGSNGVIMRAPY